MDIRFEGLHFARPDFTLAADWSLPSGSRTALIGPSGAGKSTLLGLIAGFETPIAGRVRLGGVDMAGVPPQDRPVTLVFQDHNLFAHLTVAQNVGLGLDPGLRLSASQMAARDAVLDRVGLGDHAAKRPGALSGGQQSRVALARALLRDRPILLLDEPFAALGPALRHEMLDLVADLSTEHGMTVLMVTHDPNDAARIAENLVFVADGIAAPPVPTAPTLANPPPALAAYLGR